MCIRDRCDTVEGTDSGFRDELGNSDAGNGWLDRWRARLARETVEPVTRATGMRRANPAVIPRNHRVEAVLDAAVTGDLAPLEDLLRILASPCEDLPHSSIYRYPPEPDEVVHQTFCGT